LNNANAVAPGTYFKPDPITGAINCIQGVQCNSAFNANDYFPLVNYQNIYLRVTVATRTTTRSGLLEQDPRTGGVHDQLHLRQGARIRDGYSGNGGSDGTIVDPLHLANNYGVLAYDHTQILTSLT